MGRPWEALVDVNHVDPAKFEAALVDRVDRRVGNLAAQLLAPDAGRVDADVDVWPDANQLLQVLLQQLLLRLQHQDAGAWKLLVGALARRRNHHGLAGADAGLDDGVAVAVLVEPAPQIIECAGLVGAEGELHGFMESARRKMLDILFLTSGEAAALHTRG